MTALSVGTRIHIPESLAGVYRDLLERVRIDRIVERIWERDHTLWRPDAAEIENRLGWLDLPDSFRSKAARLPPELAFATDGSVRDVVLLGMGGSSLCPLVLAECLGARPGFPNLHVLDTTVPSAIVHTAANLGLSKTIFLVSSKSGGTIEVTSCFEYFYHAVSQIDSEPGQRFIAITDPGTGLARLAAEKRFVKVFENPPDIGGRFSALSYFGMVPAALLGLDVDRIIENAKKLSDECRAADSEENPGAQLGAYLAACQAVGRDKLTLQNSPGYASVGLWIEQLLAESTGKEGKGILPLAEEPLVEPWAYGSDRSFASLKSREDNFLSVWIRGLEANGCPFALFEIEDPLALGAEFFRWEFATAVASHFLDIHPFDQPNVEESKQLSKAILEAPGVTEPASLSFSELLDSLQPGDYFAILAYIEETPQTNQVLFDLRKVILKTKKTATTLGYGPRFLHSTGQYHKGGPNTGAFLQIVEETPSEVPIPGKPYGFAQLCAAQAVGDFQALANRGRRVARVKVGTDPVEKIRELIGLV